HLETEEPKLLQFGLITTNSITQIFNRRVVRWALTCASDFSIRYAVPDHPWVSADDGAAVRIAMTVGGLSRGPGIVDEVVGEEESGDRLTRVVSVIRRTGLINSQ